jgi:FKBP-type peptidyl-prolyl cis-trans isomerase 2
MPIKNGDKVEIDYTGTLDDGTVFDSSEKHGKPLEFSIGAHQVIKGFEDAVVGMEKGQEKDIKLQPADAYGDPNPDLIKKVPKNQLPKDKTPEVGMTLVLGLPNGAQMPAKITEIADDTVTIDLNPPMAGKVLNFKIKVVDVTST